MKLLSRETFLSIYAGVLTVAFASVVLLGARRPANASFDQITVHRINVVEPDGTTRLVIADQAEFPGAFYHGKEYPRSDRRVTGMLFNNDEGTENGGLIFGGAKTRDGMSHSWGHLSFDEYERDQTVAIESNSDGDARSTYVAVNDDDTPYAITPAVSAEWQQVAAMPPGPGREQASKAWHLKYPGGIVSRGYFGRGRDRSVSLELKDQKGRARLVARVAADGTPALQFLDENGKVVRSIKAEDR